MRSARQVDFDGAFEPAPEVIDGRGLPGGVYLVRIVGERLVETQRLAWTK